MRNFNIESLLPRLLFAAVLASAFAACSRQQETVSVPEADPTALAVVAGTAITANDLLAEAEHRKNRNQAVPTKEVLLAAMVDRAAMIHRANESGLAQVPDVRRALDSLLVSELRQRELQAKLDAVDVSVEEMRTAYDERASSFKTPAKAQFAILHLVVEMAASDTKREELRARMTEARAQALAAPAAGGRGPATGGFGALAVEYSDDQVSRYRGGDAGWFAQGESASRWPAEVVQAGHALVVGEVSEVIEATGGVFLVRKTAETAEAITGFEDAVPAIRQSLLISKRETLEKAFRDECVQLADVRLVPEALDRVTLPTVPSPTEQEPPAVSGVCP